MLTSRSHDYDKGMELAYCKVCHGGEASLPRHCPGRAMSQAQQDAVQWGTLDFINGSWWRPEPQLTENEYEALEYVSEIGRDLSELNCHYKLTTPSECKRCRRVVALRALLERYIAPVSFTTKDLDAVISSVELQKREKEHAIVPVIIGGVQYLPYRHMTHNGLPPRIVCHWCGAAINTEGPVV